MSPFSIPQSRRIFGVWCIAMIAVGAATLLTLGPTVVLSAPFQIADGANSSKNRLSQAEPAFTPNAGFVTELFLPLVAHLTEPQSVLSDEEAPPLLMAASSDHTGNSSVPPVPSRQTFVADTGGDLDRYLSRTDLAGGRLKFTVNIAAAVRRPHAPTMRDGNRQGNVYYLASFAPCVPTYFAVN